MERGQITEVIKKRLSEMGTPKSWFYSRLGMNRNTFETRLEMSNWKDVEILALKQMGVI
jgi:transcriptional regulator with AAA-type ATPase domain